MTSKKTKKAKAQESKKKNIFQKILQRPVLTSNGGEVRTEAEVGFSSGILNSLKKYLKNASLDPAFTVIKLLRGLLFASIAFLFGKTPLLLDAYPLAIALLGSAEKNLIYIFIGASVSVLTVESSVFSPSAYITAFALIILTRALARIFIDPPENFSAAALFRIRNTFSGRIKLFKILYASRFEENTYLKMATSCAAAFLVGLYSLRESNYRYYDLFSAIFAMLSAPALCYIFSGIWVRAEDRGDKLYRDISTLTLLTASVYALRETFLLGISASAFVAFLSVLYFSKRRHIVFTSAAALCMGLAVSPVYAPSFVLAAISSSVIEGKGSGLAPYSAASAVAALWGAYIDGIGALTSLIPAFLSASVFAMGADVLTVIPRTAKVAESEEILLDDTPESTEERMERLAVTFGELSKALYEISDRLHSPGIGEAREICLEAFEKSCEGCGRSELCRKEGYGEFSQMVTKAGELLSANGRLSLSSFPDHMKEKCGSLSEVSDNASIEFANLIGRRINGEKTELIALDYEAISHIISEAIASSREDCELDRELCERLSRFGKRHDMGIHDIVATGKRKKRIYLRDLSRRAEEMGAEDLRCELEEVCGFPLKELVFELRDNRIAARTESAKRYSVESGKAFMKSGEETVCGDTVITFENSGENFYSLISDGMGSGQSAAFTSEICGLFLSKMLMSGNRKETALKMLNTLLRSKGEECSATIDLMELDLISGKASFIKSGAAPTFVKRGDKLYKLRSGTAPIGIMRGIDAEQIRFDTEDGDVIIMMSDGVSQTPEECVWLMEMLEGDIVGENLKELSERICEKSRLEGGTDDVSVSVLRINKVG